MKQSFGRTIKRLGFGPNDRVAIIHADDIGMFHSTIPAFFELFDAGIVTSGSAMVPCPWFPAFARACSGREQADVGVHITLNSEWDAYRWGPISIRDPKSGLIDDEGYFHKAPALIASGADAVYAEARAQVDRATEAGLTLTHIDSHMFAVLKPELMQRYVSLGFEKALPAMVVRQPQWVKILTERTIAEWEEQGLPVLDHLREVYFPAEDDPVQRVRFLLNGLPAGLTCVLIHPARDSEEMRSAAADWRQRVADYEVFGSTPLRREIARSGVQLIGWSRLKTLMPAPASLAAASQ